MDSLDNIWDEPLEQQTDGLHTSSPPQVPQASSSRSSPSTPASVPTYNDVDIDAMFADVENDDDLFSFKPLTSNLDTEGLRREAEARHRKIIMTQAPHHSLSSSSQTSGVGNDEDATSKAKEDETKDVKGARKRPARLDESRLLGPTGFPKLIKSTKNFKVKGKGHEITDLSRLLQVYGYWTHEMFPVLTFRDTVDRVEKLCHSKRMHVALSTWRDEAHGLVNGRKPVDDEVDISEHSDGGNSNSARSVERNHKPPPPLSSCTEIDASRISSTDGRNDGKAQSHIPTTAITDDDIWNEMHTVPQNIPSPHAPVDDIDDQEMWNIVSELHDKTVDQHSPHTILQDINTEESANSHINDEDDWDSVYV